VKDATGEAVGCHATKQDALKQLAALYASEEGGRAVEVAERAKYQVVEGAPGCPESKPWGVVGEDGKRLEDCSCHETEEGAKGHMAVYFAGRASVQVPPPRYRPAARGRPMIPIAGEHRAFQMTEFRVTNETKRQGEIFVCTYDIVDDFGTLWRPGVFDEGWKRKLPKGVWGHDWLDIIGRAVAAESKGNQAWHAVQFSEFDAVPRAYQAWTQMRDGDVDELSFAFDRERWENVDTENPPEGVPAGAREIMSQAFEIEWSPVLVGAVPETKPLAGSFRSAGKLYTAVDIDVARDLALRLHAGSLDITDALVELRAAATEAPPATAPSGAVEPDPPAPDGPAADPPTRDAEADARALADADAALSRLGRSAYRGSRTAIASHDTAVIDEAWDGPAAVAAMPNEAATLRYCHAWRSADGDPDAKGSYKLPHHKTKGGAANISGVRNALSRLPQSDIPTGEQDAVRAHLRKHLDKFNA
jgi:hypothetical protein